MAYDPRDFQDDAEDNKMPRLTLMEEVLLLGLKDKAVSPQPLFPTSQHFSTSCTPNLARAPVGGDTLIARSLALAIALADARARRDTYHSGTTTSHTHSEVVSSSN